MRSSFFAALLLAGTALAADAPALPKGVSKTLYELSLRDGKPPSDAEVKLGEALFNDKRLSKDGTVSCATCHDPAQAFTDGKPRAQGIEKKTGTRNSPTVLNAMFHPLMFWDGRAVTLEDQAKLPILNPIEMGMSSPDEVVAKVKGLAEYPPQFKAVFGRELNYDDLAKAIGSFERTQFSGDAPFDRFIAGDDKALDASAKRGWALFNGKARCAACHAGNAVSPLFSDEKFHNIGVAAKNRDFVALAKEALGVVRSGDAQQIDQLALESKFSDLGRFLVTRQENDIGSFKTPTLRNIGATGPYMHDGSFATLWDVVDHYNKGGVPNPYLDGGMQRLGLTESEIDDLVAFLFSLTDEKFSKRNASELTKQKAKKNTRPERDAAVATGKKGDLGDLAPSPKLLQKNPADLGVYGNP